MNISDLQGNGEEGLYLLDRVAQQKLQDVCGNREVIGSVWSAKGSMHRNIRIVCVKGHMVKVAWGLDSGEITSTQYMPIPTLLRNYDLVGGSLIKE